MKHLIVVLVLVILLSGVSYAADITNESIATITDANTRSLSAREVVKEFRGYSTETTARLVRLLAFKDDMGTGDIVIPEAFITGVTAAYIDINTSLNALKAAYPCLTQGSCEEEE